MVTNLTILEVALHQSVVNVDVRRALRQQRLQQHVSWNQKLLLVVDEFERAVAIAQVVQRDGLGKHVVSHAPHLHCIGCEEFSSVHKAAPFKRDGVVALVHD